ncbi:TPA: hypothetical protein PTV68_002486 [Clostridium botulinum]|uniref:hypothetical protein n=1 Tax=Clostridium botulinum TaxID=1491 RepID=UPI0029AF0F8D|nr:hypothetical protein [Clostridium botulinum]HDK7188745.1 hypothetical protein [Clostridium botulinum]HDK7231418.1 hypothetical protein [Clostridium botulinum]HDK7261168.1 hypothetical protein [Clostridium botulinum]HDK7355658.1 hypothetical protein [Clostridium botulinum]
MLSTTLYMDKETELNIEEVDNRFCLKLNKLFDYDLSIVGQREVFEKIYEILEQNLYDELTYKELEEEVINKEILTGQAQDKIDRLQEKVEFLQGRRVINER